MAELMRKNRSEKGQYKKEGLWLARKKGKEPYPEHNQNEKKMKLYAYPEDLCNAYRLRHGILTPAGFINICTLISTGFDSFSQEAEVEKEVVRGLKESEKDKEAKLKQAEEDKRIKLEVAKREAEELRKKLEEERKERERLEEKLKDLKKQAGITPEKEKLRRDTIPMIGDTVLNELRKLKETLKNEGRGEEKLRKKIEEKFSIGSPYRTPDNIHEIEEILSLMVPEEGTTGSYYVPPKAETGIVKKHRMTLGEEKLKGLDDEISRICPEGEVYFTETEMPFNTFVLTIPKIHKNPQDFEKILKVVFPEIDFKFMKSHFKEYISPYVDREIGRLTDDIKNKFIGCEKLLPGIELILKDVKNLTEERTLKSTGEKASMSLYDKWKILDRASRLPSESPEEKLLTFNFLQNVMVFPRYRDDILKAVDACPDEKMKKSFIRDINECIMNEATDIEAKKGFLEKIIDDLRKCSWDALGTRICAITDAAEQEKAQKDAERLRGEANELKNAMLRELARLKTILNPPEKKKKT